MADETNKNGDIPGDWRQQVDALRDQEKWDDMISRLSAVIPTLKTDVDKAIAYFRRGYAYDTKGEFDRAIADFNKAIELKPDDADAYNNRGYAYDKKGEHDRAIVDFNKAIELNPNDATTYNNRGYAYRQKGEYDRAIADYSKAMGLKPDDAIAYHNRGSVYNEKGEFDRAIADYSKAIKLKPDDAITYNNRGYAYNEKSEYDRAITDCNKAIELNPDYAAAYNNRGHAYANKGEHDKAIADWKKAIELAPRQNPEMVKNLLAGIEAATRMSQQVSQFSKKFNAEVKMAEGFGNSRNEHDDEYKRTGKRLEYVLWRLFGFYLVAFVAIGVLLHYKEVELTPLNILPWIPVVFLISSPAVWAARMLNRDKTRHLILRENAHANYLMTLLLPIEPRDKYQEGLFKQFFDRHDFRGSPQLIIDLENKRRKGDDDVVRVDDSVIRQLINLIRQSGKKPDGK